MGSTPCKLHLLPFLILYCIASLVHAGLNLDPSDSDAISLIKKDLGFTGGQPHTPENHCYSSVGIFCERRRRISGDSPVLRVTRIVLDSERLNGFLSPTLGRLSELKELSLSNNLLVQQIPSEIVHCRKLEVLNLRNNRFSGKIPPEFSSLVSLRSLDLSSNKFSGDLSFLKYFPNLENLSLADNLFAGKIPMSLRSFRNLRFLNLSGNSYLQGSLPESMTTKIEYSSPSLSSENILPKRYIFAEKKNSTKNNHDSAIAPSAEAPSPSAVHHKKGSKHKNPKTKSWIFGFLVGGVAGVISGFLLSVLFKLVLVCMRERAKEPGPMIFSSKIKKLEVLAFLEKEDGMASLELIGRGGCGEVYRAELPGSNGTMIAIKKIIQPSGDAAELNDEDSRLLNRKMRQVQSEIKTVGQIRHRNLLPLLAHVPRPDCHFLIYEYMRNGSLQDVLDQVSKGTRELDWLVRHRISVGIAAGLEYLHIHHSPRIIHRDLKPGNILLDDNMEARIADFGLAKAVPDAYSHVTTNNVAGTVGFIAPEYHQMLKFTDKCDIYSFGVLLAALVTGKLPSDEFFQHTEEMSLIKWLRNVMNSENPSIAIDLKLMGNGYENQMLLVLRIACFCTRDDPKQRPNSKEVGCMLAEIKH